MEIKQTSSSVDGERWKWSIWVEATPEEYDQIAEVTYKLHPTFKRQIIKRRSAKTKFRLNSSGWGTFVVDISIAFKSGLVQKHKHRLKFYQSQPSVFISYSYEDVEKIRALELSAKKHGIRVLSAKDIAVGEDIQSSISKKIEESNLMVLLDGKTPSRWVMNEVNTARNMGKRIVSLGSADLYGLNDATTANKIEDLDAVFDGLENNYLTVKK